MLSLRIYYSFFVISYVPLKNSIILVKHNGCTPVLSTREAEIGGMQVWDYARHHSKTISLPFIQQMSAT